jgi:hypothetical protein
MDVTETLKERGSKYGDYAQQAEIIESLLSTLRKSPNWVIMEPYQRVALYMICLKLGRICTGDVGYDDNWRDIAGYAVLVERELNK